MRWILPATVFFSLTKPGLSDAIPGTASSGTDVKSVSATKPIDKESSVIAVPANKIQFNCEGGVDGPDGFEEYWCCEASNLDGTYCLCTTANACYSLDGTPGYACQDDSGNTCARNPDDKQLDNGPFADNQHVMQQKEGSHRPGGQ